MFLLNAAYGGGNLSEYYLCFYCLITFMKKSISMKIQTDIYSNFSQTFIQIFIDPIRIKVGNFLLLNAILYKSNSSIIIFKYYIMLLL